MTKLIYIQTDTVRRADDVSKGHIYITGGVKGVPERLKRQSLRRAAEGMDRERQRRVGGRNVFRFFKWRENCLVAAPGSTEA